LIAVHFGAGNIGRGFIGKQLVESGYEVCFVDVNQELVADINEKKGYTVILATDLHESFLIEGVKALDGNNHEEVAKAIAGADLVTTAVGPNILKFIAPAIAQGIALRLAANPKPLQVIACENMIGGSSQLKEFVLSLLNETQRKGAALQIGFPDSAVDRIVPIQSNEDKLTVIVEPFYEWIVDESQIIGQKPHIEGVTYVPNLLPFIERKLFTVNTGHCYAAYLGYNQGYQTIDQAMGNELIYNEVKHVLQETGKLLAAKHDLDPGTHEQYIGKILTRFANPHLPDEVTRVGRSPIRKLSPNDRLTGPAMQAYQYGIEPNHLAKAIAAAFQFDYLLDPEAVEIQAYIKESGIKSAIDRYTGITQEHPLNNKIMQFSEELKQTKVSKGSD
jgi:mannitol-1-phosphate 5-dehydrogenase